MFILFKYTNLALILDLLNKTIENYKMCTKNKENCDSNLVPNVKLFSGKYIFTVKND